MVNIEELRKKYNQINKQPAQDTQDFLKKFLMMEEGTTQVRVLPAKDPDDNFYAETGIHRINDKNYHCPKVSKGEDCPLCDLSFKLWNTKESGNQDIARQIKARKRFYLNAVERESGEVKILSVGIKLFSKIVSLTMITEILQIYKQVMILKLLKINQGNGQIMTSHLLNLQSLLQALMLR